MHRSKIEWVLNPDNKTLGWIWNPLSGCLNHINGLCKGGGFPCYAYKLAKGRLRERYLANPNYVGQDTGLSLDDVNNLSGIIDPADDPFYPRFWSERLAELERRNRNNNLKSGPIGIFVCDMSDLFGVGIPEEWTRRVLDVISSNLNYPGGDRFYLLTKQPQNLIKFSPFPDNCWVGVTVTSVEYMADAVANLACTEAKVKFMSFEPLLGSVMPKGLINFLDWVIIGAQTKPMVYPKDEWVQEIEQAADNAGIPVFEKNNLYPSGFHHLLRQEMTR